MLSPLIQLLLLQWRSFFREPGVLFWSLVFPILLSGLLGLAYARKEPAPLPIVLLVQNSGEVPTLLAMTDKLPASKRLKIHVAEASQAQLELKRGKVVLAVQDASDEKKRRYLLDSSNPDAELALMHARAWFSKRPAPQDTLPLDTRGSRYIDFLLPGLLAFSVINSCLWGVAWTLIDYRQKKLMRRMVATPMSRAQFFFSLFLGRCILITLESLLLLGFGLAVFGFHIQGSPWAFLSILFSGILAFFGLGALIASRTSNSQVGAGLINAATMPMLLISGIFFSYERFPDAVQPYLRLFPPTMMVDALRAVANEGAGLSRALPSCLALTLMGLLCLGLTRKLFRWY